MSGAGCCDSKAFFGAPCADCASGNVPATSGCATCQDSAPIVGANPDHAWRLAWAHLAATQEAGNGEFWANTVLGAEYFDGLPEERVTPTSAVSQIVGAVTSPVHVPSWADSGSNGFDQWEGGGEWDVLGPSPDPEPEESDRPTPNAVGAGELCCCRICHVWWKFSPSPLPTGSRTLQAHLELTVEYEWVQSTQFVACEMLWEEATNEEGIQIPATEIDVPPKYGPPPLGLAEKRLGKVGVKRQEIERSTNKEDPENWKDVSEYVAWESGWQFRMSRPYKMTAVAGKVDMKKNCEWLIDNSPFLFTDSDYPRGENPRWHKIKVGYYSADSCGNDWEKIFFFGLYREKRGGPLKLRLVPDKPGDVMVTRGKKCKHRKDKKKRR